MHQIGIIKTAAATISMSALYIPVSYTHLDVYKRQVVSMPLTTNCNRIRHDVLRQCHAGHAGVADVVDICTGHLAHQRNRCV